MPQLDQASVTPHVPLTMAAGIRAAAQRQTNKIAIKFGEQTRTFADLATRIDRITNATVADIGLERGQNAAIVSRNCIEYLEIVCGVPEAGIPVATVSARLTPPEIAAICDDAEAKIIFVDRDSAAKVRKASFKAQARIIELGEEFEAWLKLGNSDVERPPLDETAIWTIPYTSGTTGKPKGVMLSHRARILNYYAKAAEYGCFTCDDRFLSITPMNYGPGLGFPLNALFFGSSTEIMDQFDPEAVMRKLKYGGITAIYNIPTHFHRIFQLDPAILDECRRPPIKAIISNSAPLTHAMKKRIIDYFGEGILHEMFGSTENSPITNIRPKDQLSKIGSVGLPFAMTLVKILDNDGRECEVGKVGELFSTSPYLFSGYCNRPEDTAAAFKDGWVSVGDLARRDADGYIYIVGRKKEMIISGGVNIYPNEIEELLLTHPAISEAAVIGIPDEEWGERLKAFVVLNDGHNVIADDLIAFCKENLASYKVPTDFRFMDALPRNTSGKVVKNELKSLA
jgi:acyl-CoA synthetase (AMP-forming)/AMP-acid ligase II